MNSAPGAGWNLPAMTDLARLRQATYRMASETLLLPEPGRWPQLAEAARALLSEGDWVAAFLFFPELNEFLRALHRTPPDEIARLQVKYQVLFGPSTELKPPPLNEAGYLQEAGDAAGLMLASIEQHYSSAGVSIAAAGARMPDHISTELEFVSLLCGREADAWEAGDLKAARRSQDRQRRFMEKHTSHWLPMLCNALRTREGGVFALAACAARSMVVHDMDFLDAMRPYLREPSVAVARAQTDGTH